MNDPSNTPTEPIAPPANLAALPDPVAADYEFNSFDRPPDGVLPESEVNRLTAMNVQAARLNRVTIRTNFQQAIQDALLSTDPKARKDLPTLTATFRQWAEGESLLGLN